MMTIRVLYDDGGFLMPHGGVSRYYAEMIRRLPSDIGWKLAMESTANFYLQQPPFNLPPHRQTVHDFIKGTLRGHSFYGVSYLYKFLSMCMPYKFPSGEMANRRRFSQELKLGEYDILHLTNPHPARCNWRCVIGRKPIVVTIHDLIPEIVYGDRKVAACRCRLLKDATHIIAVSKNTKNDIIRLYKIPENKISVIHHGYLPITESGLKPYLSDAPYILYVGKRGGYKRFNFLIRAIAPLLISEKLKLFCTGNPFTEEELRELRELGIVDRVVQRFVSDDEMMSLFAGAVAFVYPSGYEGFGIPILDAFSAQCPVVLPQASCFPEVAGSAALFYTDGDACGLRNAILRLLHEKGLRISMINKGRERLKKFSWDKCANVTAMVYRNTFLYGEKFGGI